MARPHTSHRLLAHHQISWDRSETECLDNLLGLGRRRVGFVEYRKEDPRVPIKEVHKMSVEQLAKEMKVVGLARVRTVESLPSQHIVIFEKLE